MHRTTFRNAHQVAGDFTRYARETKDNGGATHRVTDLGNGSLRNIPSLATTCLHVVTLALICLLLGSFARIVRHGWNVLGHSLHPGPVNSHCQAHCGIRTLPRPFLGPTRSHRSAHGWLCIASQCRDHDVPDWCLGAASAAASNEWRRCDHRNNSDVAFLRNCDHQHCFSACAHTEANQKSVCQIKVNQDQPGKIGSEKACVEAGFPYNYHGMRCYSVSDGFGHTGQGCTKNEVLCKTIGMLFFEKKWRK